MFNIHCSQEFGLDCRVSPSPLRAIYNNEDEEEGVYRLIRAGKDEHLRMRPETNSARQTYIVFFKLLIFRCSEK